MALRFPYRMFLAGEVEMPHTGSVLFVTVLDLFSYVWVVHRAERNSESERLGSCRLCMRMTTCRRGIGACYYMEARTPTGGLGLIRSRVKWRFLRSGEYVHVQFPVPAHGPGH